MIFFSPFWWKFISPLFLWRVTNSCSTPRSFLRSTLHLWIHLKGNVRQSILCHSKFNYASLIAELPAFVTDKTDLVGSIFYGCLPFGSSKEEVLREVETLSVLWMRCRFKYARCLLTFGPRCTRRTCSENNSFIKQPRVQRVKSLLKFSFSSFECFKMSFTNTTPSSAYS